MENRKNKIFTSIDLFPYKKLSVEKVKFIKTNILYFEKEKYRMNKNLYPIFLWTKNGIFYGKKLLAIVTQKDNVVLVEKSCVKNLKNAVLSCLKKYKYDYLLRLPLNYTNFFEYSFSFLPAGFDIVNYNKKTFLPLTSLYSISKFYFNYHLYPTMNWQNGFLKVKISDSLQIKSICWEKFEKCDFFTANKGIYLINMKLAKKISINVGKHKWTFDKGYYVYVGSALNSLSKRIMRHLSFSKNKHWHIDYFLPYVKILNTFIIRTNLKLECVLASKVKKYSDAFVPDFGSSDCKCVSHLFLFFNNPFYNIKFLLTLFNLWKL